MIEYTYVFLIDDYCSKEIQEGRPEIADNNEYSQLTKDLYAWQEPDHRIEFESPKYCKCCNRRL